MKTIENSVRDLMAIEPFFGLFAISVSKSFSDIVPTACVTADKEFLQFNLLINKDFWNRITDDQKTGLVWHEMQHLAEFHLSAMKLYDDPDLANIAMDIRINKYIPQKYLPPLAILPNSFPPDIFPGLLSSRQYYDLLKDKCETNKSLKSLLDAMRADKTTPCWHKLWKDFQDIPDNLQELYKYQIQHQIQDIYENYCNKNMGLVPGHLKELIDSFYQKIEPIIDWTSVLRLFGSNSVLTETKTSRSKLNIRYPDQPAIRIVDKKSLIIVIDVSASMSKEELKLFFEQVDYLTRLGIEITIIQCDARVQKISTYKRGMPIELFGRGGTNFEPVMQLLNNDRKYNAIVYYTDGCGSFITPPKKPCLWVITENGKKDFKAPHNVIHIKKGR